MRYFGFDLASRAAATPTTPSRRKAAKSTIMIWLSGGASHIDTWDMKPDAPAEYRGSFKPIATSAPGIQLCEHLPHLAKQLQGVGADALVLFNRFYQPDFDLEQLDVVPRLALSRPEELLLRLHWIAILYGNVEAELAVTGGVHSAQDVLKSVMAGAQVAMMVSELLAHGIDQLSNIRAELMRWMEEHEYQSIDQMRGSLSRRSVPDPSPFERGNYIKTLNSYTLRTTVT